jgi:DNA-binding transcriptional regulator YbjK
MKNSQNRGSQTKSKLVNAAIEIISTDGLSGISANKVAVKANVSKSSVFHHFDSIDDLLEQSLHSLLDVSTMQIPTDQITLEEFFYTVGYFTFNMPEGDLLKYQSLLSFYNEAMHNDRYKDIIMSLKNRVTESFQETLKSITQMEVDKTLIEMMTIDLDGLGMHFLIDRNIDKYMKYWEIKSKYYCDKIRGL